MNLLKLIYLTILLNVVFSNTELIIPATHISTDKIKKEIVFVGFQGEPNKQKTAKTYTVNATNQITENNTFDFTLSKEDEMRFFSAHYDDFLGDENKELVLISTSPAQGMKFYIWEETEPQIFKSLGPPHIIYETNNPTNPKESIVVSEKDNRHKKIAIVFGSPNRKITLFEVKADTVLQNNIAEKKLNNQAGTIIFKSFYNETKEQETLYILNNGQTKTLTQVLAQKNEEPEEKFNINKPVKDFFVLNQQNKIFLLPNNQLFFSATQKNQTLTGSGLHHEILFLDKNEMFFLDKNGDIVVHTLNKDKNNLTFKEIIKTEQKNQNPDKIYSLTIDQNGIIVANSKNNTNEIVFHSFINKKENEETKAQPTYTDSLIFVAEEANIININLDPKKQFLNLESLEQPESMTINLDTMQLEWQPSKEEVGYYSITYNIEYAVGSKIQEQSKGGKIAVESIQETIIEKSQHIVYVNAKPTIKINPLEYKVQAGHTLNIPVYISDPNQEQILILSKQTTPPNKGNIEDRQFIWIPEQKDYGNNTIIFRVDDGIHNQTTTATVFVDTTKNTTKYNQKLIVTQGEEFVFDLQNTKATYHIIDSPNNLRITNDNVIHWIALPTQLGLNTILLEKITPSTTERFSMEVFVNAPPIISFRPNNQEIINYQNTFNFILQSFDSNINQTHFWNLETGPTGMTIDSSNTIKWEANVLDHHAYLVNITDSIDSEMFFGEIYVNYPPKIISEAPEYIDVDQTFEYNIVVEDKNQYSPHNKTQKNKLEYNILTGPETMMFSGNTLIWHPKQQDAGTHHIEINVSDGADEATQTFSLYVNDIPQIISTDSLRIMVGDTLLHFIAAQDQNPTKNLTYSISTEINNMYLNAKTGELSWIPTFEDLGQHTIQVAVTDGFDSGNSMQTIQVYVHGYPKFLTQPNTEAFVNLEYVFIPQAQNAKGGTTPQEDYIVKLTEHTFSNMVLDSNTYVVSAVPQLKELGEQTFTLTLEDLHNNKIRKTYNVLVINSPCETDDSLKVKPRDLETKEEEFIQKKEETKKKENTKNTQPRFRIPGYKTNY